MSGDARPLVPGLYFVATPIGAARDITLRALDILAAADVIAAEDTRTFRHLMEIHGVSLRDRPVWAYHDHNGASVRPRILQALADGRTVAYASEAGTPLVADPGYQLSRAVIGAGHAVFGAPGASALLAALVVSGLPTDRFMFAGFAPPQQVARTRWLARLAGIPATLILYESPKRISGLLGDMMPLFGPAREVALCRELTKRFEEVTRGGLADVAQSLTTRTIKGEIVLVVGAGHAEAADPAAIGAALAAARRTMTLRDAASFVAEALDVPRRDVYRLALALEPEQAPD